MTEQQFQFSTQLKAFNPVPWDMIPDLGLYMDQVITFLERQCKELFREGEKIFTPSMVNNYVKIGLVDRPIAKKYGREQLAQLLMICVLKQIISSEGMKTLVKPAEGTSLQEHYEAFCQTETTVFSKLGDVIPLPPLTCAVQGAAYALLCSRMLFQEKQEKQEKKATEAATGDDSRPAKHPKGSAGR